LATGQTEHAIEEWPSIAVMSSCPKPNYAASREAITNAVEYEPELTEDRRGKLVKQPDNPYVARVGRSQLYFLDSRLPLEEALEKKEQLDMLHEQPDWQLGLDYDTLDAWRYDIKSKEVVFRFKNEYSRVFFADIFNRGLEKPVVEVRPTKEFRTVKYDLSKLASKSVSAPVMNGE
jgi:hypothetical protein